MEWSQQPKRLYPAGPTVIHAGVHFRVWAPRRESVEVILIDGRSTSTHPLVNEGDGYFSAVISDIGGGQRYFFRVDADPKYYPDPASHYQPDGVHGPSEVVDSSSFAWTDQHWPGMTLAGQVIYELHIGTWTAEGTWTSAAERLSHLADIGVTLIEVMPVAEFAGEFGWGYDGVCWYAPTRLYGRPDDFRHFVNEAHRLGMGVLLDVVYNHFGPSGNYTGVFSPYYISKRHPTEWGEAINFDGEAAEAVREFVTANAAYWIREFHLDGLRLDATQALVDDSEEHIVTALGKAARQAAGERSILLFAEDEYQRIEHVERCESGGYGLDGVWNDDFHHACRVAASGHAEFYYADYAGSPQELISAVRYGYLYQGQWNARQGKLRGTPALTTDAAHFVNALQNHDQVANSPGGKRGQTLTSPGRWRALTTLQLLAPGTPLLFMGQEWMSSVPFHYFADHEVELARLVREGRWNFLRMFPRIAGRAEIEPLTDPSAREAFEASKLDWVNCARHARAMALHRDLLRLRREDLVFSRQDASMIHGAVIGTEAFLLRWLADHNDDRLILINLGRDLNLRPVAQPLLAPPRGCQWTTLFCSESPAYGGVGVAAFQSEDLIVPGHTALVFRADPVA